MGPLLAGLEFTTNEDTTNITVFDVFKRGLPDVVTIVINEMWYRIRDSNGRPTSDYALVPRMAPLRLPDGATLDGGQIRPLYCSRSRSRRRWRPRRERVTRVANDMTRSRLGCAPMSVSELREAADECC